MLATKTHLTKDDIRNGRMLVRRIDGLIRKPIADRPRYGKTAHDHAKRK
jgi:hypothetical protein